MPSRLVGMWMTLTPRSQVAATKPARSVTAPPPTATTASERVKSFCPSTCQQKDGHLDVLAFFGVRDFGGQRGEAGGGQFVTDGVAGEPEGAGMDDQDPLDALPQQRRKACQQAAAHHDVVVLRRRTAGDLDDG